MEKLSWQSDRLENGSMSKKREVWVMPEMWVLNFIAAWRTFERTVNPTFTFHFRCGSCGSTKVYVVKSTKHEKTLIGIECEACLRTLKFEKAVSSEDDDFPERLLAQGVSVLKPPDGESKVLDAADVDDIDDWLFW